MRWHFASSIGLFFLYIPQVSDTVSFDMCSNKIHDISSGSNAFDLLVNDVNTTPRNCSCEITANRAIFVGLYLSCACSQCGSDKFCPFGTCFCSNVDLSTTPTCMPTFGNPICPGGSYRPDSCGKSMKFTINLSTKPLSSCRAAQKNQKLDLTIQLMELGDDGKPDKEPDPAFKEVRCNVVSVTSAADSKSNPDVPMIIGIVVGVGGAVLLTTAIVIVVVVCRRRRAESNRPHANDASRATPAAAVATGEAAYESYTVPVVATMAAYDNATIGATPSDQTLAYDNERVGEAINPYAEVKVPKERGDDNGYDNNRIGRNEVISMYKGVGKDYDNFSENPSMNVETETTVIDNEFYG